MSAPTPSEWAKATLTALAGGRAQYPGNRDLWDTLALALDAAFVAGRDAAAKACDERETMFEKLEAECESYEKHALASIHGHRCIEARSCADACRALKPGAA